MIDLSSISTSPDPPLISLVFQYEPNIGRSPIDPCFRISCVDRDSSKQLETSLQKKRKCYPACCLLIQFHCSHAGDDVSVRPVGRASSLTLTPPTQPATQYTTPPSLHPPPPPSPSLFPSPFHLYHLQDARQHQIFQLFRL